MTYDLQTIQQLISSVCLDQDLQDITHADDLFDRGVLDSISIVQLVTKFEEKFDISFDFKDLTRDNFRTIESVGNLLATKYGVQLAKPE